MVIRGCNSHDTPYMMRMAGLQPQAMQGRHCQHASMVLYTGIHSRQPTRRIIMQSAQPGPGQAAAEGASPNNSAQ